MNVVFFVFEFVVHDVAAAVVFVDFQRPRRVLGVEESQQGLKGKLDLPPVSRLAHLERDILLPHLGEIESERCQELVTAGNPPELDIDRNLNTTDVFSGFQMRGEQHYDLPEERDDLIGGFRT